MGVDVCVREGGCVQGMRASGISSMGQGCSPGKGHCRREQGSYYSLNACVPPNSMLQPVPSVTVVGDGAFGRH